LSMQCRLQLQWVSAPTSFPDCDRTGCPWADDRAAVSSVRMENRTLLLHTLPRQFPESDPKCLANLKNAQAILQANELLSVAQLTLWCCLHNTQCVTTSVIWLVCLNGAHLRQALASSTTTAALAQARRWRICRITSERAILTLVAIEWDP
jgi:hypothetical protein